VLRNLLDAIEMLGLSARAFHRIWTLALTLADLDGLESIEADRVAEAITYRSLDRTR
jgi:magnesium chelatase family protein